LTKKVGEITNKRAGIKPSTFKLGPKDSGVKSSPEATNNNNGRGGGKKGGEGE